MLYMDTKCATSMYTVLLNSKSINRDLHRALAL